MEAVPSIFRGMRVKSPGKTVEAFKFFPEAALRHRNSSFIIEDGQAPLELGWRQRLESSPPFEPRQPVGKLQVAAPVHSPRAGAVFTIVHWPMNEHPIGGISGVDPIRAIDLIWTLGDVKAKRTLLPPDPDHLRELPPLLCSGQTGLRALRQDAARFLKV
jgi:hypothetical protein